MVTKYTNECLIGKWNGYPVRTVCYEGHAYMVLQDIFIALNFKEDDYYRSMFASDYQEIFEVRDYGKLLCVDTRGIVWATSRSKKLEIQQFQSWALDRIENAHAIHRRRYASDVLYKYKEKKKEKEETTNAE